MPIIGKVGRTSFRVRGLNISIHMVLLIGAITMIYPFMLMVSGSLKSNVDSKSFNVCPRYIYDDDVLFKKYVEARYCENSSLLRRSYRDRVTNFDMVTLEDAVSKKNGEDWLAFLQETKDQHSVYDFRISELSANGVTPKNRRAFVASLREEADGDIQKFNKTYNGAAAAWDELGVDEADVIHRRYRRSNKGIGKRFEQWKAALPIDERVYLSQDAHFVENELKPAYQRKLERLNKALKTNYRSWEEISLSPTVPDNALRPHWENYVRGTLNLYFIDADEKALDAYHALLKKQYGTIAELNSVYGTSYKSFSEIQLPDHASLPSSGPKLADWAFFIENSAPVESLHLNTLELQFRQWLKKKYGTIQAMQKVYGMGYKSLADVPLTETMPKINLGMREDWLVFAKTKAQPDSMTIDPACQASFLSFLADKFPVTNGHIDVSAVNAAYGTNYDAAINIYPAITVPSNPTYRRDWLAFVCTVMPPRFLSLNVIAEHDRWVRFLTDRYGNVDMLNAAWSVVPKSFSDVAVDYMAVDKKVFKQNTTDIFFEFLFRNYLDVFNVFLYNGNAITNTLIYCSLAILIALIVNPLAAYGMSRYKLPSSYKIILILMLTMAFPPMVMGIPSFLLIKNLGLLNTFLALILPAAADGYFIFLLKGFFDSLPKELFEAAVIDGAKERQIFWNVAMALSKPIMAVIALNAFNAAYRNFMMAFLICQDPDMWTLMVHIYQLTQRSSMGVSFAALVVASVPTFLVFVFCQNIIIRGIVVPTEK